METGWSEEALFFFFLFKDMYNQFFTYVEFKMIAAFQTKV